MAQAFEADSTRAVTPTAFTTFGSCSRSLPRRPNDVVEDCPQWSLDKLMQTGYFTARVITGLKLLTHDPAVPYDDYIKLIATSRDATLVKLADLKDNSNITHMKVLRKKDFDRLEKYNRSYAYLSEIYK